MQSIYLAGGCFWCTEAVFLKVRGVEQVTPGYIGGFTNKPSYSDICSGNTGHAEAIKCDYYKDKVSLDLILDIFFLTHDPTQLNRQGNDIGTQYRSSIFIKDKAEEKIAKLAIERAKAVWNGEIQTELSNKLNFTSAEKYHHNYYENNPGSMYCNILIPPKIKKLKDNYPDLFID
tara:strand:+ start:277 stop:801 length:525 start_codon:yes stop_codon:yes gene_type:complete